MKKILLAYILLLTMILTLPACQRNSDNDIHTVEKVGTIILSVNPAVELEYDREGLVIDVIGLNEDGLTLAAQKEDLLGVPCLVALQRLIVDIHDAGFFISDFGGEGREIFLYLEKAPFITKAS